MRLMLRGDNLVERLGLWLGVVPRPAGEAWGGMAVSAMLMSAVELGIFARLAAEPTSAENAARELDLDPAALELLLNCLTSTGYLRCHDGVFRLRRRARRWFDPTGSRSVAAFVRGTTDYWAWWQRLPNAVRTGHAEGHHTYDQDDPFWRRYIEGQHDLARMSAPLVARRLRVPAKASSMLDIGGGHGRYSVELCRRHPGLSSTVLDLPGSVRIGRDLVAQTGLTDRVGFRAGDARTADLGGPYQVALCFNLVHHLTLADVETLFRRVRDVLAPGGTLAILDGFAEGRSSPQGDALGLFTFVSSGVGLHSQAEIAQCLVRAGFATPRRVSIRPIPGLALYQSSPAPDATV